MWFAAGVVAAMTVTVVVSHAWRVDASPGDIDSTFVPTTPCRLIDTRDPGEVAFGPGETRTMSTHGSNGECTIPTTAVALSMNVTTVDPTAPTFLTFWPEGSRPVASSMNPFPGEPPTPNGISVQVSATGTFQAFNLAGDVDVVIDIDGYYVSTSLTELSDRVRALELEQPFTIAAPTGGGGTVGTTPVSVKDIEITAPVDGTVTVISTGYIFGEVNGQLTSCGIMDSVSEPFAGVAALWQSPSGSDFTFFSVTRAFDFNANQTKSLRLVCLNTSGGTSNINSPQLMAIFTPDPPPQITALSPPAG